MIFPESRSVTGALFGFSGELEREWLNVSDISVESLSVKGWSRLIFASRMPLLGEVDTGAAAFYYFFLLRESGRRILLLGEHSSIVDILLERAKLRDRVFCPSVEISGLVRDLVASPASYVMSAVYARVQGFGQSLRSMSLYGSDVGEARLFREILDGLQPYRVTLRKVESGEEILSIGSRGEVSFHYGNTKDLREVDAVLRFLAKGKYIDWAKHLAFTWR